MSRILLQAVILVFKSVSGYNGYSQVRSFTATRQEPRRACAKGVSGAAIVIRWFLIEVTLMILNM